MRVVLGIDAAWTETQPSGVALAVETATGWELRVVRTSYGHFLALADPGLVADARIAGSLPRADALLRTAVVLAGRPVDLVAIDMPLSLDPITGRRTADDAVSRAYGGRKCGTHTPSASRPGPISDALMVGLRTCGYPLQTRTIEPPGVIEVYPHPALVELTLAAERLPYKLSKVRSYWRQHTVADRRLLLIREWTRIVEALDDRIAGTARALPAPAPDASGREMKAHEDRIDAVVCAWVAICALDGGAMPFGDDRSAIWIPSPAPAGCAGIRGSRTKTVTDD